MQNEDQKPEPKPASSGSMKPPRPPRGTVVGTDGDPTDPQKRVRLIDGKGKQLGIMTLAEAKRIAQSQQSKLVGIASTVAPPIYRLVERRSEAQG